MQGAGKMNIFTVLTIVALIMISVHSNPFTAFYSSNGTFTKLGEIRRCTDTLGLDKPFPWIVTDKCIVLYARSSCSGECVIREAGTLWSQYVDFEVRSIGACSADALPRLEATVINIDVDNGVTKTFEAAQHPVDIAAAFKFTNNGSQVQEKHVTSSKTVKQEFTVEKIKGLSNMHHIGVDLGTKVVGKVGIPFAAESSVEIELKASYAYDNTATTSKRDQETTSKEKTFTLDATIRVSPCKTSVAQFLLYVAENQPVEFELTMIIRVKKCGNWIPNLKIRQYLPSDVKYLSDHNETAITATTKGQLLATVGLQTHLKIDSYAIPGCGVSFVDNEKEDQTDFWLLIGLISGVLGIIAIILVKRDYICIFKKT